MKTGSTNQPNNPQNQWLALFFGLSLMLLGGVTGCGAAGRDFRTAALPAVESGVTLILNGVLDGIFAAIRPEPQTTP